jgi:hypothetical protein
MRGEQTRMARDEEIQHRPELRNITQHHSDGGVPGGAKSRKPSGNRILNSFLV